MTRPRQLSLIRGLASRAVCCWLFHLKCDVVAFESAHAHEHVDDSFDLFRYVQREARIPAAKPVIAKSDPRRHIARK